MGMTTTTVRLDEEEAKMLAELAPHFGGKSGALRHALRRLSEEATNRATLARFVDEWNSTDGTPSDEDVADMIDRFDH